MDNNLSDEATRGASHRDIGTRVRAEAIADYDPSRLFALVVGIDRYEHFQPLRCAVADAREFALTLTECCGFPDDDEHVRLRLDSQAEKEQLVKELDRLLRELGRDDSLVIYYAGHGWRHPDSEVGYWIPPEAREDSIASYLSNSVLLSDFIAHMKARHITIISDSCFAGTLFRGATTPAPTRRLPAYYGRAFSKPSRLVLTSGDLQPVPDQGAGRNSLFNLKLCQLLRYGDRDVYSPSDIWTSLREEMAEWSAGQSLRYGPLRDPCHSGGEFVFCRTAAPARVEEPPPEPEAVARIEGPRVEPPGPPAAQPETEAKPRPRRKGKRGALPWLAAGVVVLLAVAGALFAARAIRSPTGGEGPPPSSRSFPKRLSAAEKAQALLAEGMKLHEAKDYAKAVAKLDDLIYRYPETSAKTEAETLKTRCEKALADRKEAEAKVKAAFARAKVQEEAGLIEGAVATLGAVLPDAPDNSRLRAEIARLRKVHHERTTAAQRERSYRQFMDAGLAAEIRRDWSGAAKAYESALANKDTAEAKRKLAAARHSVLVGKAKGEADLDKRIDLYVQALSHENRPETRALLAEAQTERRRREEVAAAKRDFAKWMGQGRKSEEAGQWDAAKRCYERAGTYAAKAGADEQRQAREAVSRCDREVARIERTRRRKAEQARLLKSYETKLAEARRHEQAKDHKEAIASLEAARGPGARLDERPDSYGGIGDAVARLKKGLAEAKRGRLPCDEWTSQRKRVKVATPTGDEWKEIVYYTNTIGMLLVKIPAGEFMMGDTMSPEEVHKKWPGGQIEWYKRAHPRHRVVISKPFYMGATEVTRGQFGRFAREKNYKTDGEKEGKSFALKDGKWGYHDGVNWRNPLFKQADDHPVVCVSWNDAAAFCQWLSKKEGGDCRLPTEAEWEYAARAGSATTWYWGNDESGAQGKANVAGEGEQLNWSVKFKNVRDGHTYTAPAGSFMPNAFGLYDMIGNTWEWCADRFDADYYSKSPTSDPKGPSAGLERVLRGGSWDDDPWVARAASRLWYSPDFRGPYNGFRVVYASR